MGGRPYRASCSRNGVPTHLHLLTRPSPSSRRLTVGEPGLIPYEPAGRRLTAARLFVSPGCSHVCAGWGGRGITPARSQRSVSAHPTSHPEPFRLVGCVRVRDCLMINLRCTIIKQGGRFSGFRSSPLPRLWRFIE